MSEVTSMSRRSKNRLAEYLTPVSILLAMCVAFTCIGCGNDDQEKQEEPERQTETTRQPKDKTDTPVTPPGVTRVAGEASPKKPIKISMGYVEAKSSHKAIFEVRNPLDSALTIESASSECKCLVITDWPKHIPPRGHADVKVDFIAPKNSNYSGRMLLSTKDPKLPIIVLSLRAAVGLPLEIEPKTLSAGKLTAGESREVTVTLINHGPKPVRPVYGTSSTPDCTAKVPRGVAEPSGGKFKIPVVIRAAKGSTGTRKATVRIHTDCQAQASISVPISYEIVGDES